MKKVTPILFVDAIEPSLPFWRERLGFAQTTEVPHGDRLGFVILERDGHEVMLQTWASLEGDLPAFAKAPRGISHALYLDVDDFADTVRRLEGCDVVMPPRKTFYGADEIWVREPSGHLVGFAYFEGR